MNIETNICTFWVDGQIFEIHADIFAGVMILEKTNPLWLLPTHVYALCALSIEGNGGILLLACSGAVSKLPCPDSKDDRTMKEQSPKRPLQINMCMWVCVCM